MLIGSNFETSCTCNNIIEKLKLNGPFFLQQVTCNIFPHKFKGHELTISQFTNNLTKNVSWLCIPSCVDLLLINPLNFCSCQNERKELTGFYSVPKASFGLILIMNFAPLFSEQKQIWSIYMDFQGFFYLQHYGWCVFYHAINICWTKD